MSETEYTDGIFNYPASHGPFEMQEVLAGPRMPMPSPSPEMLASPLFEAVWQAIKTWDVNVPESYGGYCGVNGSHVAIICNAILAIKQANTGT